MPQKYVKIMDVNLHKKISGLFGLTYNYCMKKFTLIETWNLTTLLSFNWWIWCMTFRFRVSQTFVENLGKCLTCITYEIYVGLLEKVYKKPTSHFVMAQFSNLIADFRLISVFNLKNSTILIFGFTSLRILVHKLIATIWDI